MKLFIILYLIFPLFLQSHIRRVPSSILSTPSNLDLPTTPKAQDLRNHFGISKYHEIYGPNFTVSTNNLMAKNNDGTWAALLNFNNDSIMSENCDIKRHSFYKICAIAKDCSICSAMDSCGWCETTRECLPGNIDGCYCENACPPISFFNTPLKCEAAETSGTLSNIDPYATKFIDAQIVKPKVNITVTKIYPQIENLEVKEGQRVERKVISAYNAAENRIVSGEFNMIEPVLGKIPMSLVKVDKETKTYDLKSGKEIIQNEEFKNFGK